MLVMSLVGIALGIEELRTSLRVAAEKRPVSSAVLIVEEVEDGEEAGMRRITEAAEVVNATAESMEEISIRTNTECEDIKRGPSEVSQKRGKDRDIAELWMAMEMMKREMKEVLGYSLAIRSITSISYTNWNFNLSLSLVH